MGLNEWLALIAALGGWEAMKWGITAWTNRKTNARKEDAAVDSMEYENEWKQIDCGRRKSTLPYVRWMDSRSGNLSRLHLLSWWYQTGKTLLELPEHYGEVDIPEEFAKEIPPEYPGMNDGGYVSPFFRHTCLLRFIQR